ncbi:integrin alpha-L-like protein [Labeo rohita]|uniref:Integrin alpha-L-like protein n=1 Tax=Labeo rohita TaxID=84645 RepID=A0A498LL14_LABRO|nr:integrin alpha-L-like protein [Labeo rohita]
MELNSLFASPASLSEAFNIDTEHPLRFNGTPEDFFGYSVYQTEFGNRKQIIVGAPLQGNLRGEIYSCTADLQSCKQLQRPECTMREVNVVFLFDGSSSMKAHEFQMNKDFIKNVMKELSDSSIKFAAVQFSSDIRTVFDFNDYQNGFAEEKLMKERHMKSLTNTYRAINYVLKNLLNNVSSGANPNAQKALVIITDGEPSENDSKNVLSRCDEQNIIRYIIGVGRVSLSTVIQLASEPKQYNTFSIQQYSGLQGLTDNLQKKINNIKGSKEAHGRNRQRELSQSGFSVIHQESCGPYFSPECGGKSYLIGVCYQFNSSLQAVSDFTVAYQECTKREVNVVFLFDGSSSMKAHEFQMNKDFIINVMKELSDSSIKFAAVQFSSDIRTVFDFNDYQNGFAEEKLMKERHMKSLTNTYRAINYVLKNLLNNVSSGANPNAQKALVIITDGEPSENDNGKVLSRCDEQNIIRYIIGVGRVSLSTVIQLASEPKQYNTFSIQQYSGLQGLTDNLQKKIINIKGSKEAHGRNVQRELSQSGFSVIHQESCSPYFSPECGGKSYLIGVCYQFNSSLQAVSDFTVAYQECTKREVNVVFLFDGSSSMKAHEFQMNKDFIKDVMEEFSDSSIKFAAVQFSSDIRTVFDFNDYQNGFAEEKLMKERHMKSLTNTYRAINYVLKNLLNNVSSGANPNAQKALVIITDGEPSENDNGKVLSRCDEQNIIRYIIGVGRVSLSTVIHLASEPKQYNTFSIQQYSGLQGLTDNLQKKINNIKGSKEAHGRNVQRELSQSGFSVIHQEDSVIVGSVGSNDWRGSLYEVTGSGSKETQIIDPAVSRDSYMGYSSVLGIRHGVALLFSGAPRAERTGLVTLFTKKQSTWTVAGHIRGEQVGSYFGASLSLLDVDSDGDSDFLLVGAPLFYQSQPRADGRLYVYALSEQHFQKTLTVSESTTGRFAASVASLKDLNGDSLPDVAVGAPLENEGVVYIYLGDATRGINLEHAPQQFGVSLSGQMDMNDDNLTDIVIGARGGIVLLKARPVMSVSAQLSFSPKEISLNYFECPGGNTFNAFNLTSCFLVSERTSSTGSLEKKLNVFLNLNVDVVQGINRGFFDPMDSSSRTLQQSVLLDSGFSCFSFSIFMPRCIADTVSPMKIQMNFSQTKMLSGNTMAVLDIHSRTEEYVEAITDHWGKFLEIFVGYPGSVHDARVLRNSPVYTGSLYPPPGKCIFFKALEISPAFVPKVVTCCARAS